MKAWSLMRKKADELRNEARILCETKINERNNKPYMIKPPEAAIIFSLADKLYILAAELEKEFEEK